MNVTPAHGSGPLVFLGEQSARPLNPLIPEPSKEEGKNTASERQLRQMTRRLMVWKRLKASPRLQI